MKVPPEILAVERPKNTVVFPYGKNKDRYGVRTRKGCIYDKGRRKPINGEVIGHIVNGAFVPKEQPDSAQIIPVSHAPVDLKDWGTVILCDRVCSSLLTELESIYAREDAVKIYCCAILRVCVPGITDSRLKDGYEECWLSELYPGVSLSKNVISDFWHSLGRAYSRINKFMLLRVDTVEHGDHLLVDGTLKSNESKVNSLSDFSRKARTKGTKDISLLYAFDLEKQEPICCKCFSGGTVDSVAYDAFISENKITKGIIVGDKGFPSSVAAEQFAANKNLHYLNPLKRNSKFIKDYNLHEYEGQLETDSCILYKRVYVERVKKWLYAFRDTRQAQIGRAHV